LRRRLALGVECTINERYLLRGEISADGDVVRYAADDLRGDRRVVLAVVHDELAADAEFASAVRTQVRKLARAPRAQLTLQEIYDCNVSDDGLLFVALEATEGRTLDAVLEADGPIEPRRALRLVRQLGEGLEALHHVGIVHGELRPQSVLVAGGPDGDESVKLLGVELTAAHRTPVGLRRRDASLEPYLAPEQVERGAATEATDVHALGRLLRELVAPAPSEDTDRRHARRVILDAIERIVAKALDPQPEQRYGDMTLMVNDICVALGELEGASARLRSRFVKAGALGAAALVVVTIASLAIAQRIASRSGSKIPTSAPMAAPAEREATRPAAEREAMQPRVQSQTTPAPAEAASTPVPAARDTTPAPAEGVASKRAVLPPRTAEPAPTASEPRAVQEGAAAQATRPTPAVTPARRQSPPAFVGSTARQAVATPRASAQQAPTSETPAQRAPTSEARARPAPTSEAGTDPADGSAVIDWLFKDRRGSGN
jgi:hypothetical protein